MELLSFLVALLEHTNALTLRQTLQEPCPKIFAGCYQEQTGSATAVGGVANLGNSQRPVFSVRHAARVFLENLNLLAKKCRRIQWKGLASLFLRPLSTRVSMESAVVCVSFECCARSREDAPCEVQIYSAGLKGVSLPSAGPPLSRGTWPHQPALLYT